MNPASFRTTGLSDSVVLRRQEEEGYNELPSAKPRRLFQIFISIIQEPMVYLLLGCGFIYLLIGDPGEALILLAFLFLIILITLVQENKAERALETLRELSSPRALVLREGEKKRVAGRELVREDLILIAEGDRVPADALLVDSGSVAADESLLTGESQPVDKMVQTMIYAGTTVVRGQGMAVVTAIGNQTELGKIGKSIQGFQRERTRLELHTRRLVNIFAMVAAVICILVTLLYVAHRGDWAQGILIGLTLAMAILPNELPAVLAVFLALGAWRMSRRRVLTRSLPAIENLGSATVLCVDKTGTLTLNQMALQKIFAQQKFYDLQRSCGDEALPEDFHEVLEYGILASHQDAFDPMEVAFIAAGNRYLRGTEHLHQDWSLEKEYPLSPELLSISLAWKPCLAGGFVIGAKGAPEAILDLCHLEAEMATALLRVAEGLAQEGLRVLGVAKAFSSQAPLPAQQHDFDFSFVGFIGIADPLRPEVPEAIEECRSAGVRVVMITGDHPLTASSIAKKIGLNNPELVVTGAQLKTLSAQELAEAVREVNVFSRVSPTQKLEIVEALKASGEIVAMTGDGVNDAPALKSAHIGIAMGKRGTDVARESAAIVVLDDDFGSIVEAIRTGRRVYANLRSAISYLFSVHVPIVGMSVLPVAFNYPPVLLPAHIALLHLIIEPASSVAFEMEPAGDSLMRQSPRSPRAPLFDRRHWALSLIQGGGLLLALMLVFIIAVRRGQAEQEARALVFTTLMVANILLIFINRTSETTWLKRFIPTNNHLVGWIALGSAVMMGLVLYLPVLRDIFRFSYLHPMDLLMCMVIGALSVLGTTFCFSRYWR